MMAIGNYIGVLFAFSHKPWPDKGKAFRLLHLISNIASPILDNAYLHQRTEMLARTDGLTEIYNHRSFHEHLDRELRRTIRHKEILSLAILDIDDFKKINDRYGHPVGDEILRQMARRIEKMIRKEDIFARYGGEEFTLIFPRSDPTGILVTLERIRSCISEQPFLIHNHSIRLSLSIGLNHYYGGRKIIKDRFIQEADKALYKAKAQGKNRIVIAK
jgi:diguanylate cyclase (GGDEF)-like protein